MNLNNKILHLIVIFAIIIIVLIVIASYLLGNDLFGSVIMPGGKFNSEFTRSLGK
jgi:hypothetical protein